MSYTGRFAVLCAPAHCLGWYAPSCVRPGAVIARVPRGQSFTQVPALTQTSSSTRVEEISENLSSDVLFANDSYSLTDAGRTALQALARRMLAAGTLRWWKADGYTSSPASEAHNLTLSRNRANSVASYLQTQGLGAPASTTGHGETNLIMRNGVEDQAASRRVVVTYSVTTYREVPTTGNSANPASTSAPQPGAVVPIPP